MKIYIARHGETEWNKKGLLQGWQNTTLTLQGKEEAKKLGNRLQNIKFDTIYTSPLIRAQETAKLINQKCNSKIVQIENLKEMGFGKWEGMDNSKIKDLYSEQYTNFWEFPHKYQVTQNGESYDELIKRVHNTWKEILKLGGENILIITHGVVLKTLHMIVKKLELKDFWCPPFVKNTCLTIIDFKDHTPKILLEADTSHLN